MFSFGPQRVRGATKETLEDFGKDKNDIYTFPFNDKAIKSMINLHLSNEKFDPRVIIIQILRNTLEVSIKNVFDIYCFKRRSLKKIKRIEKSF